MSGKERIENFIGIHKGWKKKLLEKWMRLNQPLIDTVSELEERLNDYECLREEVRILNQRLEGYEEAASNIEALKQRMEGYERLCENVESMNQQLEGYEQLRENVRNTNQQLEGYEQLRENVRNTNQQLEGYERLCENVRNINQQLTGYGNILINVRNNNVRLEKADTLLDMYGIKISQLEKAQRERNKLLTDGTESGEVQKESSVTSYSEIDYFDFENYFRGSREQIKKSQRQYLRYFQGKKKVVDLGCGRGEFLELLKEEGIESYGIDLYPEFVELCRSKRLTVFQEDAVSALRRADKLGGIFAGQLIEHLELSQLLELAELAYEKLEDEAYIVLETPNPMSLAIFTHAFYMDPSHNKPVHPLTMKYILEKAGFRKIDIIYTENSRRPVKIPSIVSDSIDNLEEYNQAMKEVENVLFGSQDYAITAQKQELK